MEVTRAEAVEVKPAAHCPDVKLLNFLPSIGICNNEGDADGSDGVPEDGAKAGFFLISSNIFAVDAFNRRPLLDRIPTVATAFCVTPSPVVPLPGTKFVFFWLST